MLGGAPAVCPGCANFVIPGWSACPWCGRVFGLAPPSSVSGAWPSSPPPSSPTFDWRRTRRLRRTRTGLVLTAIGLVLSWIPFVAAIAALFLSLGSTFLFLGARGVHRRHEVAVVLSFLVLTIGGVILGVLVGSFLLQGYEAAQAGAPLRDLREAASLLIWASLPATGLVITGFALQVVYMVPPRHRPILVLVSLFLFIAATAATFLADPELATLDGNQTRGVILADFLLRISLYRMIEAPPYVALAILYLAAYWDSAALAGLGAARAIPATGKG